MMNDQVSCASALISPCLGGILLVVLGDAVRTSRRDKRSTERQQ
jgi:hypothetical protein